MRDDKGFAAGYAAGLRQAAEMSAELASVCSTTGSYASERTAERLEAMFRKAAQTPRAGGPATRSEPIRLPLWSECSAKHDRQATLTALEKFVYDNEPSGQAGDEWRETLALVIANAQQDAPAPQTPPDAPAPPVGSPSTPVAASEAPRPGNGQAPKWEPLSRFQWSRSPYATTKPDVLQQLWVYHDDNGSHGEWRDVPVVEG